MKTENVLFFIFIFALLKSKRNSAIGMVGGNNLVELLNTLHNGLHAKKTAGGSIYINFKGIKTRIADHEPNYNAPNRSNDYYIYYKNANGKDILNKYEILNKIAAIYKIDLPPAIKAAETKFYNKQAELHKKYAKLKDKERLQQNKKQEYLRDNFKRKSDIVNSNKSFYRNLAIEAQNYGDLGSNGAKRRKRRNSFVNLHFMNTYNIPASFADISHLL